MPRTCLRRKFETVNPEFKIKSIITVEDFVAVAGITSNQFTAKLLADTPNHLTVSYKNKIFQLARNQFDVFPGLVGKRCHCQLTDSGCYTLRPTFS